jgi:indoleamine 2,3-dioxygenase
MSKNPLLSETFKIYEKEEDHLNPTADPFLISTIRGFLPRRDPVLKLPSKLEALDSLLNRMRWNQPNGSLGLLAKKQLGDAVRQELSEIKNFDDITDTMDLMAVYRDYSFLASAYLLEECHHKWLETGSSYGLGRDVLPTNIARPYVKISEKVKMRPFLEYNSGYSLNNFYRKDQNAKIEINNIEAHRSFINMRSEAGFILVHVAINQHGGMLIKSGVDVLNTAEVNDRKKFNEALHEMKNVLIFMNQEFERMYFESTPSDYNIFRTFILGIKNQPMFPKGVIYEGCFNNEPQYYRGESGANDSIIPFCDNILEITEHMPVNPLTQILRDFRSYRPTSQQSFLEWTEATAKKIGVLEYAKKDSNSLLLLLSVADQIRAFRHRHWILTNLYIMNFSKHPVATGGSPIVSWLPNQLLTVIEFIKKQSRFIKEEELQSYQLYNLNSIINRAEVDERIIKREVEDKRQKIEV